MFYGKLVGVLYYYIIHGSYIGMGCMLYKEKHEVGMFLNSSCFLGLNICESVKRTPADQTTGRRETSCFRLQRKLRMDR